MIEIERTGVSRMECMAWVVLLLIFQFYLSHHHFRSWLEIQNEVAMKCLNEQLE